MPGAETFDAFYARTVWNVTSQMHGLTGGDSAADHAIREAYARAYQQWYEISAFPDTENWVLGAAKDAYQRRRPGTVLGSGQPDGQAAVPPAAGPGATVQSLAQPADGPGGAGEPAESTWPGIYRPRAASAARLPADPDATVAPPAGGVRPGRLFAGHRATHGSSAAAQAPGPEPGGPGQAGPALADPPLAGTERAGPERSGTERSGTERAGAERAGRSSGPGGRQARGSRSERGQPGRPAGPWHADRRKLIAAAAALAVVIAGAAYLAVGSSKATPPAGASGPAKTSGKHAAQMLPAGHTGPRSAIPWPLHGDGWTLAETSTATPDADGQPAGAGTDAFYLIDPVGGKYTITPSAGRSAPELLAWSGDGLAALIGTESGAAPAQTTAYSLLSLKTGRLTPLTLPAGVNPVGFTRPDGLNLLAVRQTGSKFKLERYNLQGAFQANLGSMAHRPDQPGWAPGTCGSGCGALSSPDGDTAVWAIAGDEMQLVSNAGGMIRKLKVPDSGTPPSCVPVSWWTNTEVLAHCAAGGAPDASELWLVPVTGAQPTALTAVSGSANGDGIITGAWQLGNSVYATSTNGSQCQTAATGSGGMSISSVGQDQSLTAVSVPRSLGYHNSVVATTGDQLLVLALTGCPGTSSLLWFNPASHSSQTVLTGLSGEAGVIAAVPFGGGQVATSAG